jgi:hypothetical protein
MTEEELARKLDEALQAERFRAWLLTEPSEVHLRDGIMVAGVAGSTDRCPIACFIDAKIEPTYLSVGAIRLAVETREDTYWTTRVEKDVPEWAHRFIMRVDRDPVNPPLTWQHCLEVLDEVLASQS